MQFYCVAAWSGQCLLLYSTTLICSLKGAGRRRRKWPRPDKSLSNIVSLFKIATFCYCFSFYKRLKIWNGPIRKFLVQKPVGNIFIGEKNTYCWINYSIDWLVARAFRFNKDSKPNKTFIFKTTKCIWKIISYSRSNRLYWNGYGRYLDKQMPSYPYLCRAAARQANTQNNITIASGSEAQD